MKNTYGFNVAHAIFVGFLLATSYIGSKHLISLFHPYAFTAIRLTLATLFFVPFVNYSEYQKLTVAQTLMLVAVGIIGFFLNNLFFILAIQYAPATDIAVIQATLPTLVLLASCILFRRFPSFYELAAFICSFMGVVLIVSKGHLATLKEITRGELFMFLGNIAGVINNLLLQLLSQHFSPLFLTFTGSSISLLLLVPVSLHYQLVASLLHLQLYDWLSLIGVALFSTTLAFWGVTQSIASLGASLATFLIMGAIPLFVAILAYLFFNEPIAPIQIIGGALVIFSLYWGTKK